MAVFSRNWESDKEDIWGSISLMRERVAEYCLRVASPVSDPLNMLPSRPPKEAMAMGEE